MPFHKKLSLIIGVVLAALVLLRVAAAIWPSHQDGNQPAPVVASSTFEMTLNDPHILYASSFWYGLCHSEITKKDGGCASKAYLYDSGKYVSTGYWAGEGDKIIEEPRVDKQLGMAVVDEIIKTIRDSEIMDKECPDGMTVDAGWDYQLQLDGKKKRFINRPIECQPILEEIDEIINKAANAACARCKVVFISKGTLSPPNQLITTISIYQDSADAFQSEYEFQDGSRVMGQEKKTINKAKFDQLVSDALKVNPNADYDALPGCTGGSTYNLLVYDGDRVILDTGNYRCAGKGTNPSMDRLSGEMLNLFAHLE